MPEHVETIPTKPLKSKAALLTYCRMSNDLQRRAPTGQPRLVKSLAEVARQEKAQREGTQDIKGVITKYLAFLEREGYAKDIKYPSILRSLLKKGANLYDPESVKQTIAKQPWKDGYKLLAVYAYDAFAQMEKITWKKPEYKQGDTIPFVPEEKELDQLIAACVSHRMATFLQTLKETFADPTEILRLKWIDLHGNILTINAPVKGHLPGQVTISNKLVAMLNALPKKSEKIFPTTYQSMEQTFKYVRNKASAKLQNPRLRAITFRSFRHWGGTMLAHYTNGNVLTIKKALRHRAIQSTMKYIGMLQFKDDDFEVATAATVEEIKQLAQAGFQKFDELNGIHVFRKPKKFVA
jgi:integrase